MQISFKRKLLNLYYYQENATLKSIIVDTELLLNNK